MEVIHRANPFNGLNRGKVVDLADFDNACAGKFAVQDDVACSAMAFTATDFAAGQQQALAQNAGECLCPLDKQRAFHAVNEECFFVHVAASSISSIFAMLPFFYGILHGRVLLTY
ncbi:hypothetical protein SDC9_83035 [bioreactor metagenome]|uniref:Uncharacterized protein n=1 Tax=bioreactor metagenome TaxID=1076179 RepID=A0A644Z734_9ZZZZ